MIYFVQLLRVLKPDNRKLLISMLDDIQWEVEELGYKGMESELVGDLLLSQFGLELECPDQLDMLTRWVLNNQGELQKRSKYIIELFNVA